jgi:hypothetical protein
MELPMAGFPLEFFSNEIPTDLSNVLLFDCVLEQLGTQEIEWIILVKKFLEKKYGHPNFSNAGSFGWNIGIGWNNVLEDTKRNTTKPERIARTKGRRRASGNGFGK